MITHYSYYEYNDDHAINDVNDLVFDDHSVDEIQTCHGEQPENQPSWEVHYCAPCLKYLPKCCKSGESININSRSCNSLAHFSGDEDQFKS